MPRIEVQCELKKMKDGSVQMIITSKEIIQGGQVKMQFADLRLIPGFLQVLQTGIQKIIERTEFPDDCTTEITHGDVTVENHRPWYKRLFYN